MTHNLKGALLGIGNPLLDISAHVSLELLEKYEPPCWRMVFDGVEYFC